MKNILIVDDEKFIVDLLSCRLSKDHYNIITVCSGIDAINYERDNKVDLILLDYIMPDINGLDVIEIIKANNDDVKIIVITGSTDKNLMEIFNESVCDKLIKKPFRISKIITEIENLLVN